MCYLRWISWRERYPGYLFWKDWANLDLNAIEEADIPNVTIATLGKTEKITLIQVPVRLVLILIKSERPFPMQSFETLLGLALSGCENVHRMMTQKTRERSKEILETLSRGTV
jgi:hypothetical protein